MTLMVASPKVTADLVPADFPKATAAYLDGSDDKTFRKNVLQPGLVEVNERGRVTRISLERHLGFTITAERYLAADRRRDGARQRQQRYRDAPRGQADV